MTDKIKIPLKNKKSSMDVNIEDLKISVNTLISRLNDIEKLVVVSDKASKECFDHKFESLIKILSDSIDTYFDSNRELLDKFQAIEHNTHSNIDSLKNIVQHQIYDPLDYMYIKEHFNLTNKGITDVFNIVNILVNDRELLKKENPYICEVIKYKDLPKAEFSNFGKAIVYKYGMLFKRIAFFKNDGKNWIQIK